MGFAARAAAGPVNLGSTPCYLGQFIAWLDEHDPGEADGLRAMLWPDSGWSTSGIVEAIREEYPQGAFRVASVRLRTGEHGDVSQGVVDRHRRRLKGKGDMCKCPIPERAA